MTTTKNLSIWDKIKLTNELLLKGEPKNINYDSYSDYTGYSPQATIDAVNEMIGVENWGFENIETKIVPVANSKGGQGKLAVSKIGVWIGDKGNAKSAYGQSRVTKDDIGDGLKGAQTDALKKALSLFSIGNRAYLGLLIHDATSQTSNKPSTQVVSAPKTPSKIPLSGTKTPTVGEKRRCEIHNVDMTLYTKGDDEWFSHVQMEQGHRLFCSGTKWAWRKKMQEAGLLDDNQTEVEDIDDNPTTEGMIEKARTRLAVVESERVHQGEDEEVRPKDNPW